MQHVTDLAHALWIPGRAACVKDCSNVIPRQVCGECWSWLPLPGVRQRTQARHMGTWVHGRMPHCTTPSQFAWRAACISRLAWILKKNRKVLLASIWTVSNVKQRATQYRLKKYCARWPRSRNVAAANVRTLTLHQRLRCIGVRCRSAKTPPCRCGTQLQESAVHESPANALYAHAYPAQTYTYACTRISFDERAGESQALNCINHSVTERAK